MRRTFLRVGAALVIAVLGLLCGCSSSSPPDDGGADATTAGDSGAEASTICDEFTEAGAPCPGASPLRCFPLCDAGGCYCRVTPGGGPRWVCVTDTTCMPDCAPIDPTCTPDAGSESDADSGSDAGSD